MDDDIRLLAIISCDAGHSYTDIIRSNYYEMSIQSLLSSLVMLIAPVEEVNIADKIYKGTVMAGKIIEKTEEGSWGASAHEEGYQITKDTILKLGGLK